MTATLDERLRDPDLDPVEVVHHAYDAGEDVDPALAADAWLARDHEADHPVPPDVTTGSLAARGVSPVDPDAPTVGPTHLLPDGGDAPAACGAAPPAWPTVSPDAYLTSVDCRRCRRTRAYADLARAEDAALTRSVLPRARIDHRGTIPVDRQWSLAVLASRAVPPDHASRTTFDLVHDALTLASLAGDRPRMLDHVRDWADAAIRARA